MGTAMLIDPPRAWLNAAKSSRFRSSSGQAVCPIRAVFDEPVEVLLRKLQRSIPRKSYQLTQATEITTQA
jgi:hypothetical protein